MIVNRKVVLEGRKRVPMGIRVYPEVRENFKKLSKMFGSSECELFESITEGLAVAEGLIPKNGHEDIVSLTHIDMKVSIHVYRVVKKRRRQFVEAAELSEVAVERHGSLDRCAICERKPVTLGILYENDSLCHESYLCAVHFTEFRKTAKTYAWRPLTV